MSILSQDMANMQSRVDDVNKAVKQLEDSRHPRTKEVKECQTRLNKRCFLNTLFPVLSAFLCPLYHLVEIIQLFVFMFLSVYHA